MGYYIDITKKGTAKAGRERKMTKAERIFRDTYTDCRIFVEAWGETNERFAGVSCKDSESVCKRTLNAMRKFLESERKSIKHSAKLGIITDERKNFLQLALDMVERTIQVEEEKLEMTLEDLLAC